MISTQIFSVGKALLVSTIFLDVENQAGSILYRHFGDGITSIRWSPLTRVHRGRGGCGGRRIDQAEVPHQSVFVSSTKYRRPSLLGSPAPAPTPSPPLEKGLKTRTGSPRRSWGR